MGRKQVISSFSGITIDMDYILCVPSIHAIYDKEEAVIDFSGGIREEQWISRRENRTTEILDFKA